MPRGLRAHRTTGELPENHALKRLHRDSSRNAIKEARRRPLAQWQHEHLAAAGGVDDDTRRRVRVRTGGDLIQRHEVIE